MKVAALGVAVLVFATAGSALAAVNCAQVNRYLQTGRSVEDVATTMVIPEEEVRKCQEEAAKDETAEPEEKQ